VLFTWLAMSSRSHLFGEKENDELHVVYDELAVLSFVFLLRG
jgi:hypothetical protein